MSCFPPNCNVADPCWKVSVYHCGEGLIPFRNPRMLAGMFRLLWRFVRDSTSNKLVSRICTDNTPPHAHKHIFFSARFAHDHTCGSRRWACFKSHFVIGHDFAEHSFNPVSSHFLFTHYLIDATDYHTDATDWNQTKPLCSFARRWTAWPSGRSDPKRRIRAVVMEHSMMFSCVLLKCPKHAFGCGELYSCHTLRVGCATTFFATQKQ